MNIFSSLTLVVSIALVTTILPAVYAEGGGGIECPEISGVYFYLEGTAFYEENPFDVGNLAILSCEFFTESEDENLEPLGIVTAVFHIDGSLSQELIDEYGCGAILGEQYSQTYVSSTTHFASVAFTSSELLEAASDIMNQIEQQNIATGCTIANENSGESSTAESVKETVEEHEVIEDTSIEISNEDIDEETIEDIKEQIEKEINIDKPVMIETKIASIVLPNWIKDNAQWWSTDQITDDDFSSGIEYLISNGHIKLPPTEAAEQTSNEIPDWVKLNAGWWAEGAISDVEFVNGLQYLISNGIISVV